MRGSSSDLTKTDSKLNFRFFKLLCKDMCSEDEASIFDTKVCSLSRAKGSDEGSSAE